MVIKITTPEFYKHNEANETIATIGLIEPMDVFGINILDGEQCNNMQTESKNGYIIIKNLELKNIIALSSLLPRFIRGVEGECGLDESIRTDLKRFCFEEVSFAMLTDAAKDVIKVYMIAMISYNKVSKKEPEEDRIDVLSRMLVGDISNIHNKDQQSFIDTFNSSINLNFNYKEMVEAINNKR